VFSGTDTLVRYWHAWLISTEFHAGLETWMKTRFRSECSTWLGSCDNLNESI